MKQYLKFKEWTEKKSTQMALNTFIVVWIIGISIAVGISLERNGTLSRILGASTQAEPTLTKIPIPTIQELSPTPNYIQPTLVLKTYVPIPTTDPDPVISCNYKYLGIQQIRRSLCNAQFECQIGGKWYLYTSRDKCSQDQRADYNKVYRETYDATYKALNNNSGAPYVYPAYAPSSTPTSLNNTLIDCAIAGQVVGNMTYAECSQKITEHYQAKVTPVPDMSVQDYNNAVSACLNRMRALGAASSSQAQACYSNPNLGL